MKLDTGDMTTNQTPKLTRHVQAGIVGTITLRGQVVPATRRNVLMKKIDRIDWQIGASNYAASPQKVEELTAERDQLVAELATEDSSPVSRATEITVINDGQVQYPVETVDMRQWIEKNGPITNENYDQFCSEVDYVGAEVGTPGNGPMIDLCEALITAGADYEYLG